MGTLLGDKNQIPITNVPPRLRPRSSEVGGLLANYEMQVTGTVRDYPVSRLASKRPLTKLEELKARHFTLAGKAKRVAKSLAALQQPGTIQLSPEEWRWVAENADIEEQY